LMRSPVASMACCDTIRSCPRMGVVCVIRRPRCRRLHMPTIQA
jgi:hypothetical protein